LPENIKKLTKKFKAKNEELDWVGISATLFNAQLVKSIFGNFAFTKST